MPYSHVHARIFLYYIALGVCRADNGQSLDRHGANIGQTICKHGAAADRRRATRVYSIVSVKNGILLAEYTVFWYIFTFSTAKMRFKISKHLLRARCLSSVCPVSTQCLSSACPVSVQCLSSVCPVSVQCLSSVCPMSFQCVSCAAT